jgi:PAS domain S-box-containing protein
MSDSGTPGPFFERAARFLFAGSIRRVLVSLVLAAILPALGIILYAGLEARGHSLQDAQSSALLLAGSIAQVQEHTTRNIHQLLAILSKTPQVLAPRGEATSEYLAGVAATNPVLAGIFMADAKGDFLAASQSFDPVNIADRDYFRKAVEKNAFAAGEYQVGRTLNVPVFPFAYPLHDAGGRVTGVIGAAVNLDAYAALFQEAGLPADSVLSIVDRNGFRLCRFPEDDAVKVGAPLPENLRSILTISQDHGVTIQTGADGVRRIYGFAKLSLAPGEAPYITILVGIPEAHGLAVANALLGRNLALLGAAAFLAMFTAWFLGKLMLVKRMVRLMAVTEAVGAGDLTARVHEPLALGELGRLEKSVNAMATALDEDAKAQRRYEEALKSAYEDMERRVDERTSELREANTRLTSVIRHRALVQEALRLSDEKHRTLYEQSPAGILLVDIRENIIEANPAALNMLGYSIEEATRLRYRDLIAPENLAASPLDWRAFLAGETVRGERVFKTKGGGTVAADVSGRLVNPSMFQIVLKDVTERKKLEQLREDVDRITRHDLKTPLLSLVHVPAMLLKSDNLTPRQREFVTLMREAAFRMLRTINMSLALYKMEAKTYQCDRVEFDLLGTMLQLAHENSPYAQSRQVSLNVLLDGAAPADSARFPLLGEEDLCVTMLENLVKNAIEASPKGEAVILDLDSLARTLSVRNKGEVPLDIRERFFEKYATAGKKWGTGLGTYSARLIASTLGFSIRLDSSRPGETTVVIHFPPG